MARHAPNDSSSTLRSRLRSTATALSMLALSSLTTAAWSMDLKQAYESALSADARIRSARATNLAAQERLPLARAQLLPQVTLSASENRNWLDTTTPTATGDSTTARDRYTSSSRSLNVRMAVMRPQLRIAHSQAEQQVAEANHILASETRSLATRVAGNYFDALLAHDQLASLAAQQTSHEAQLRAAQQALLAGTGTRTDVDLARARLDMTLASQLEARQQLDYTRRQLQSITQMESPRQLMGSSLDSFELPALQPQSVDHWLDQAVSVSPDIAVLRSRRETARLELDRMSAGHYPTLDLVGQWSHSKSDNITRISSTYDQRSIGLQLNWPIYSGGQISALERQATANLASADEALENGLRELRLKVVAEYRGVTEGAARVRALVIARESALVSLDSSRKSYTAGVKTLLDVLSAEQDLRSTERNLMRARYETLHALIRLHVQAGENEATAINTISASLRKPVAY